LRHVFEAAPNGFVIVNEAGKIEFANNACCQIFGYEPDELLGKPIDTLIPARIRHIHPEYRQAYMQAPENRPMGHGRDLYGQCKDGTEIPVEIGLNPIESDGRTLVLASIVDITERKRSEEILARYTSELERSNEELDEFAYVASHDLRTPLEGITNLASWIEADVADQLPEESRRHLAQIQQRADRLKILLEDLLEYSRAGRLETSLKTVDVAEIIQDTIAVLAPPEGFHFDIAPDLPTLHTVETPLKHIFQNLLGNAVKHHHETSGNIAIRCRLDGDFYTFSVSDDGPGIHPSFHEKIFMMFETLKPRDRVEGSGMGLAIIKKLLATYGGTITVDSDLDQGTTFHFTWPKDIQRAISEGGRGT
jgi:PAS domain S-box-containing protein